MDSSEVGRFGTLHLKKRLDPNAIAASYPIDEEEITIGRDPSCSIRLYYESVSALHCKIVFRERKAFVEVFGTNGLLIDGCPVFPSNTPSPNPVTVPLSNSSTIEVHNKCFQFCYPPKEMRSILLATPPRYQDPHNGKHRRRTLRMSMIQSAHVFSPGPSEDPRENLRILQTPMKTPFQRFTPAEPSPLKRGMVSEPDDIDDEEEEENIVLVESNHPKVVEEDKDLVILEHVDVDVHQNPPPGLPRQEQHLVQFPIPQPSQPSPQVPRTPRRRAHPRASLHRAVLIRSAQRTAHKIMEAEEEEQEVEEVEETIQSAEMEDVEEVNEEQEQEEHEDQVQYTSGWRKSLEAVAGGLTWPFRSSSVARDEEEEHRDEENTQEQQDKQDMEEEDGGFVGDDVEHEHEHGIYPDLQEFYEEDQEENAQPGPSTLHQDPPMSTAPAPRLGEFMTPQAPRISRDHIRYSMGGFTSGGRGEGPRRVKLVNPWKVKDLVVPVEYEVKDEDMANPFTSPKKERLSEEERNAILERRRSALHTPDTFAPGIGHLSKRMSVSPRKAPAPLPALSIEPIREVKDEEGADLDTSVMLARMKQMVDGVKKRQSMGPRPSIGVSPRKPGQFSLFAPDADLTTPRKVSASAEDVHMEHSAQEDMEMIESTREAPEASSSERTLEHTAQGTPKFTGVRERYKEVAQEMATPRMDGMRDLFRSERVVASPVYEGVGEMLATPDPTEPANEESVLPEPQAPVEDDEEPVPRPAPTRSRKPASTSKIPAAAAKRTTPRSAPAARTKTPTEGLDTVAEDDDTSPAESSQPKRAGPASRVSRKPRSRSVDTTEPAVPDTGRATRARSVTKGDEVVRSRLPPQFTAWHQSTHDLFKEKQPAKKPESIPKGPPVRRGRKAAESPAPPAEVPPTTKSTRRPRAVKSPTEELEDMPTTATATRGSARKATHAKQSADDEADPLDAFPQEDQKKEEGAKVRRSARGKVKEEDTEDSSPILAPVAEEGEVATGPSRSTRTRKTPAPSKTATTPAVRSTTRGKAESGKAASGAKKVAEEEVVSGETGDKENTPEASNEEETSASDGSAATGAAKPAPKAGAKVTRSATKLRSTPTVETEEKGKEALKTRGSRTKTAAKK
ncbi:hypothetical protein EUX98_g2372 [Antrodiella citrinella]|uniref:FHA domain-containing protein n=1 Tax=Antrodiella citrinella TaxID=2447956 RepID=A0A4S4MZ85_9APHY|nr:hypothetical protein EUX98_g2372 [Antrodiella citrinella]